MNRLWPTHPSPSPPSRAVEAEIDEEVAAYKADIADEIAADVVKAAEEAISEVADSYDAIGANVTYLPTEEPEEERRVAAQAPHALPDGCGAAPYRPDRRLLVAPPPAVNEGDWEAVAGLLGRAPQGAFEVVVRDAAGESGRHLELARFSPDGTPMPTRYWLVGRIERESVSRLESTGGVRAAEAAVDAARARGQPMPATRRFATPAVPAGHRGPRPSGGVGGTRRGVKCLHAHLAWFLAGGTGSGWSLDLRQVRHRPCSITASPGLAAGGSRRRPLGDQLPRSTAAPTPPRLLVVDPDGRPLERLMRITRLGQGLDRNGRLDEGPCSGPSGFWPSSAW